MGARSRERATVLVTDAGLGSAIAIIRSLGQAGYRVIAADASTRSGGMRSRYAHGRVVYAPPMAAPQRFAADLLREVCRHKVDLVIPVTDAVILPLSECRDQFQGACLLALPEPAALQVAMDKHRTWELAARLGVPVPRTSLVHSAQEALEAADGLGWPVVLKPKVSRLYRDRANIEIMTVCYAEDAARLGSHMRRFDGRCPVLLQQYCAGTGHGVEMLLHSGRPLAAFQHRRIREVPITGGASALRESVPLDPVLYDHARRLMAEMRWTGLAMVEFKVGPEGPVLMEVNGRVWGSLPLAVRSGMDFPRKLAEHFLQGPPPADAGTDTSYRVGVRARNLGLDLTWIATVLSGRRRYPFLPMPRRREAVAAMLALANPTCRNDSLALDDPLTAASEIARIVRQLASKVREATGE